MKYIKLFENHADYAQFTNTSGYKTPNLSFCIRQNELHTEKEEERLILKFMINANEVGTDINIFTSDTDFAPHEITDSVTAMEVDGVLLDEMSKTYQFDSEGLHTVKYTLVNPEEIYMGSFAGCSNIVSVSIPSTVNSIGIFAFANDNNIESIEVPRNVTGVSSPFEVTGGFDIPPFYGAAGLKYISVESGNNTYDSRDNCNSIILTSKNKFLQASKNTLIPNTVKTIGAFSFGSSNSSGGVEVTNVRIPNSVKTIEDNAFYGNAHLEQITIPDSVTYIGAGAFGNCTSLKSAVIGNGVKRLNQSTFSSCASLESVVIGDGIEYIDNSALSIQLGATRTFKSLTIMSPTPPLMYNDIFADSNIPDIFVPAEYVDVYKSDEHWSYYQNRIYAIGTEVQEFVPAQS